VGHTEINAWGQTDLYSLVVTSTGKLTDWTKNQECVHAPGVSNRQTASAFSTVLLLILPVKKPVNSN
jgi:hypothetical protein